MRLADLLAGLSRLADVGFGLPMGAAVRSCALATRLAHSLDLSPDDVRTAYYTALLHHVGCVGYAHETAQLFGDDLVANRAAGRTNAASLRDTFATFLPELMRERPPLERARLAFAALAKGGRWGDQFTATACEIGRDSARRMGLPEKPSRSVCSTSTTCGGSPGTDIPVSGRASPGSPASRCCSSRSAASISP